MSNVIDSMVISLGLDPKGVKAGMAQADKAVSSGLGKITGALKGMIGPLLGAFGAAKLFGDYIGKADALGKFAAKVGESITDIDAWGQAVMHSGGSAEGFQATVDSMTKSIAEIGTLGTGRAKMAFEALGISVKDSEGNLRKATDVLAELSEKAETMDKAEFAGLLTKAGVDQGTIMLLQQGKLAVSDLVGKMRELSYTQEDAETTAKFNDSWQDCKKSLQMVAAIVLREVLPALTWLSDKVKTLFVYLKDHKELVLAFFGGLAAVIMAQVIPAFVAWFATMLANPITWVVMLLAGLALLIEDLIVWVEGGESAFGKWWESLFGSPDEAKHMWKMLTADLKQFWEDCKVAWEGVKEAASAVWSAIGPTIATALSGIGGMIVSLGQAIVSLFSGNVKGAFQGLIDFANTLWQTLTALVAPIGDALSGVFDTVFGAADAAVNAIKGAFQTGLEAVKGFIQDFIIGPIEKALGLISKAKSFLTGESDADYGMSKEDLAAKSEATQAERFQRNVAANKARAAVGDMSSAGVGAGPAGDTTQNIDQSVETNISGVTFNITSTDPAAAGQESADALYNMSDRTSRSTK